MEQLYQKLKAWIDVLDSEVIALRRNQLIFHETEKIVRSNPAINVPNCFHSWMIVMYSVAMSVAVRRLADNDKDCVSFRRLLETIKEHPSLITRTRLKENLVSASDGAVDIFFDEVAGAGKQTLDISRINEDIQTLLEKTSKLKTYVDRRIAHHDRRELNELPYFQDLDIAIDFLEELLQQYRVFFQGCSLEIYQQSVIYDLQFIFSQPWIKTDVASADEQRELGD